MFRASRGLQSREMNEVQASIHDRIDKLANAIFGDGDIVSGLDLVRLHDDPDDFDIQIASGEVYIQGFVYSVDQVKLDIPLDKKVALGLRLTSEEINENDDAGLKDPAVGSGNFDNPGASRVVTHVAWGWIAGDGSNDGGDGTFFPVFTVDSGVPILRNPPPSLDAVVEHVAKYDYNAHRNYVGYGLECSFMEEIEGEYHFNLREGRGNIRGFMRERLSSTRLIWEQDFDTKIANNEPHAFVPVEGQAVITVNRFPIHEIGEIFGVKVKTETVTRGAFAGGSDQLLENSVLTVLEVKQGGTTYVLNTDYIVSGDDINWVPAGAEPAPGSGYQVTYQYQAVVEPVATTDTTITLEGLVSGTFVNIDYTYKLPRVDLLTMGPDGLINRIKGESLERNPAPKQCPDNHLPLATVTMDWMNPPIIDDIRDLAVPVSELNELKRNVADLFDLLALERLRVDMAISDPAAKKGIFVDAFHDDDLRDSGAEQTAAIIDGVLTLPFESEALSPDGALADDVLLLPHTLETIISQESKSACMRINPYAAFDPLPSRVRLIPAVDRWIEQGASEYVNTVASSFVETWASKGKLVSVSTSVQFRQVALRTRPAQFIRQREVGFTIDGFGPGEGVSEIKFDNIEVTHSVNLEVYEADLDGKVEGFFMVPPNVQLGAKEVRFTGSGGSFGVATYVASGTIESKVLQKTVVTIVSHYDPLAQTFTLTEEDRIVAGVSLKFCLFGDVENAVYVQLRETQVGIPTSEVIAEGRITVAGLVLNTWVDVLFETPVHIPVGREYAIVILTDDGLHSVGIARLGDFVTAGNGPQEGWVTSQPYQIGALLASSNASTWTPVNEADLTFKLLGCKFTTNQAAFDLGDIAATNVTDIRPLATVVRPSAACEAEWELTEDNSGTIHRTPENRPLRLEDRITDDFNVTINLKGTPKLSPVVYPNSQILTGNMLSAALYFGRMFPADVNFAATVTFHVLKSGSGNCVPTVLSQLMSEGSPVIVEGVYQKEYLPMTLSKSEPLGDGWVEQTYTINSAKGWSLDRLTQVKLTLVGTPKFRVYVRQLRMISK